jgi:hypothetical protein
MNTILKSLMFAAAVSFAGSSNAAQYTIEGVLTEYTVNNLPSYGISVGDSFTGELVFDPAGWTASPAAGLYRDFSGGAANGLRFNINIGGQKFSMRSAGGAAPNQLLVRDSLAGDSVEFSGHETLSTPWGPQSHFDPWNLLLSDLAGGALSSVAVPSSLNLVDWPDAHYIHTQGFMDVFPDPGTYSVTLDIRSMTAVPDVANTGLLLVLVLSIPLCLRRLSRAN